MKKIIAILLVLTMAVGSLIIVSAKTVAPEKVKSSNRMEYLFPKGTPKSDKEMKKHLKTISVKVRTLKEKKVKKNNKTVIKQKWGKATLKLTVHKKLATNYKKIFKALYSAKFPIKKSNTACYSWRYIDDTNIISSHAYGAAIDVNWYDNLVNNNKVTKWTVNSKVLSIFAKYGFGWGGKGSTRDKAHFSYTNSYID